MTDVKLYQQCFCVAM